jgi:hypothetical protein
VRAGHRPLRIASTVSPRDRGPWSCPREYAWPDHPSLPPLVGDQGALVAGDTGRDWRIFPSQPIGGSEMAITKIIQPPEIARKITP